VEITLPKGKEHWGKRAGGLGGSKKNNTVKNPLHDFGGLGPLDVVHERGAPAHANGKKKWGFWSHTLEGGTPANKGPYQIKKPVGSATVGGAAERLVGGIKKARKHERRRINGFANPADMPNPQGCLCGPSVQGGIGKVPRNRQVLLLKGESTKERKSVAQRKEKKWEKNVS